MFIILLGLKLMPKEFLSQMKLEDRIKRAQNDFDNTIVAIVDDKIVGFVKYLDEARDMLSIKPSSEIVAIYLLRIYQKRGICFRLIRAALERVQHHKITLIVLQGNDRAIAFYQKVGFRFTGHKVVMQVPGGDLVELEMVYEKK